MRHRRALVIVAAIAVAGVAVGAGLLLRRPKGDLDALAQAAGTTRLTESRPSGGFEHGALATVRGPGDVPWRVLAEIGRIEEKARGSISREDLRALSVAEVLAGRPGPAIGTLEALTARGEPDAAMLGDLAAAYLERSRRNDRADDLPRALDAASRALAAAPTRPEALWNRALALEKLHLRHQAMKAWDAYLDVDPSSGWAEEARQRRARLPTPPPPPFEDLQPARERLATELFPAWAEAWLSRRADEPQRAAEITGALQTLAAEEADTFDADLARYWRSVPPERKDDLARGHLRYAEGFRLFRENQVDRMRPRFVAAAASLRAAQTPYAGWARFHVALADMLAGHYGPARHDMSEIEEMAERGAWLSLDARAAWLRGLMQALDGDHSSALPFYRHALSRADAARDGENGTHLTGLLGDSNTQLGRHREGWRMWKQTLARASLLRRSRLVQGLFLATSNACSETNLLHAAPAFQDELWDTDVSPAAVDMVERARQRAALRLQLGDVEAAMDALRDARAAVAGLRDGSWRARLEPDLQLTEGDIALLHGDAPAAVAAYRIAVDRYRATGHANVSYDARLRLAKALVAVGDGSAAERELAQALDGIRNLQSATESERLALLERTRPIARELLSLRAERDGQAAVRTWNAHAAALVDGAIVDDAPVELHEGELAVFHVVREDELVRLTVSAHQVIVGRVAVSRAELARLVRSFRFLLTQRASGTLADQLAGELFELLLGDDVRRAAATRRLVLVPDDVLAGVPFAALLDPASGRRVVDRWEIVTSPALVGARRAETPVDGTAVVVGNPLSDGFEPLPEAEREAVDVAQLYGSSAIVGHAATREEVLARAAGASIFHFAGHAERGSMPALVLAGAPDGTPSRLLADDPTWRPAFSGTSLAVLAACNSGDAEEAPDGTGSFGLARPFLAAGVPWVVATLWDVDDRASSRLMLDFHQQLRRGRSPAAALAWAQRRFRDAAGGDMTWAAFVAVNGR